MSGIKVKVRLAYLRKKIRQPVWLRWNRQRALGSKVKGGGSRAYMAFVVLVASQGGGHTETLTDTLRIA